MPPTGRVPISLALIACLLLIGASPISTSDIRVQVASAPSETNCPEPGQLNAGAFDAATNRVYITPDYFWNELLLLNASTGLVAGSIPLGGAPDAVAIDTSTGDVYVAYTSQSSNIEILNGTTGSSLGTLTGTADPDGIAFDDLNGNLYASSLDNDSVTIIDGTTRSIEGYIPLTSVADATLLPRAIALDPLTAEEYVAAGDGLYVINTTAEAVTAVIPVGTYPDGVAVANGGERIFVANSASDNVSVVNASSGEVLGSISLPLNSSPSSIAFDPASGTVYVAESGTNEIVAINATTNLIEGTFPTGRSPVAIVPTPHHVFVANYISNNVSVISGAVGSHVTSVQASDTYSVTFSETGLPASGAYWGVRLEGPAGAVCAWLYQTSPWKVLTFNVPNGSHSFQVQAARAYSATPESGAVIVSGKPLTSTITFSPLPTSTPRGTGLPVYVGYIVAGVLGGAALGYIVAILSFRRRKAKS